MYTFCYTWLKRNMSYYGKGRSDFERKALQLGEHVRLKKVFTVLSGKRDKKFCADWRLSKMLNAFLCLVGCFLVFLFLWQMLNKAHLKLLWEQFALGACRFCVSAGAHLCKGQRCHFQIHAVPFSSSITGPEVAGSTSLGLQPESLLPWIYSKADTIL